MQVQTTQALNKLRKLDKRVRIVRGGTSAGKTICILLILIDYAIKNNCKRLVMNGRKGWLKVLNKLNWNEGYTVLTKELNIVEKGE